MVAKIIKTDGKNIEINFDGWNKKWNIVSIFSTLTLCLDIQHGKSQISRVQESYARLYWPEQRRNQTLLSLF
jgi:hypothetical protein